MTANKEIENASVKAAHLAKAASVSASVQLQAGDYGTAQRNLLGGGTHAAYEAAIKSADAAHAARVLAAEQARQAAIAAAIAVMQASGENAYY